MTTETIEINEELKEMVKMSLLIGKFSKTNNVCIKNLKLRFLFMMNPVGHNGQGD